MKKFIFESKNYGKINNTHLGKLKIKSTQKREYTKKPVQKFKFRT